MKRLSAVILLVAFAAFFIEAVKLPSHCQKQVESKYAMMMKTHPNCKMMAEMMKKHSPKKDKSNSKDCPNCPLFAVSTFKEMIGFSIPKPITKIEYSVMLNNNLSDYHSQQWKPPDISHIEF